MHEWEREWREGAFLLETSEATALKNTEMVCKCSAMEGLITMQYEDYLTSAEADSEE